MICRFYWWVFTPYTVLQERIAEIDAAREKKMLYQRLSSLTLMLLWLLWSKQNTVKKVEKLLNPWHMGTHLRVLSESYPMTTIMTARVLMVVKNVVKNCIVEFR